MTMPDVFEQLWDSPTAYMIIPLLRPEELAKRYGITMRQAQDAIDLARRIAKEKKTQKTQDQK
jgi:hypothetical protein